MEMEKKHKGRSLLEPASTGGDTAQAGFGFQTGFIVYRTAGWISYEGFTEFIQEAISDVEASFFVPGQGYVKEFCQVKRQTLTPSEFWDEIREFQRIDKDAPGTYRWFTLVSQGLSKDLKPLAKDLRRIRDPYRFYQPGNAILEHSFSEYVERVKGCGGTEEDAPFLFSKVLIECNYGDACAFPGLFKERLLQCRPEYRDLPARCLDDIYQDIASLVGGRIDKPISRNELEEIVRDRVPNTLQPHARPVSIHTTGKEGSSPGTSVELNWIDFFGGTSRSFPPAEEWDSSLVSQLVDTRDWIIRHRSSRCIHLTGERRLSAMLAIGSVFSAVSGFTVELEYRGELWSTDVKPLQSGLTYDLEIHPPTGTGNELIASIGILRDIKCEVEAYVKSSPLASVPALHIVGKAPITCPEHAGVAVHGIKDAIGQALVATGASCIHLFYAGPSHVALFLGHRLNATATVKCYERVAANSYVQTCTLHTS